MALALTSIPRSPRHSERSEESHSVKAGVSAEERVRRWAQLIRLAASRHRVSPSLIAAVMLVESGGNPEAESPMNYSSGPALSPPKGRPLGRAQGLMQVMPWHFGLSLQPDGELTPEDKAKAQDPEASGMKGAEILRRNYQRWGTWPQALAAYFGAIDASGNITGAADATGTPGRRYVEMVLASQERFQDLDEEEKMDYPGLPFGGEMVLIGVSSKEWHIQPFAQAFLHACPEEGWQLH